MKKTLLPRILAWGLCLSALLCALGLTACAPKETALLSLDGQTVSVNHYQLLLCREKATAQYSGFTAWTSIADLNSGKTYDETAKLSTLESAKLLLAALVLFEEEGLSLPDSTLDEIDQKIEDMKNADAADGSNATFNSVLSAYGINKDILRDIYVKEAKFEMVKAHLYGEDKMTPSVQQQFINDNVVAFKQILVPTYHFVYEADANGDVIYYLTDENNAKVNNIAYDIINGYPRLTDETDKDGHPVFKTDKNGDTVYYVSPSSDHIAYDKSKGVRAVSTDAAGNPAIVRYEQAEKADLHSGTLIPLTERLTAGNFTSFESEMAVYYATIDPNAAASTELSFLYTMENHYVGQTGSEMLSDIADALKSMAEGEIRVVESESGYHVIMKYGVPSDTASNTAYASWFGDLNDVISTYLFRNRCVQLFDGITFNEEAYKSTVSMAAANPSYYY